MSRQSEGPWKIGMRPQWTCERFIGSHWLMSGEQRLLCSRRYHTKYGARMAAIAAGIKRKSDLTIRAARHYSSDNR